MKNAIIFIITLSWLLSGCSSILRIEKGRSVTLYSRIGNQKLDNVKYSESDNDGASKTFQIGEQVSDNTEIYSIIGKYAYETIRKAEALQ